MSLAKKLALTEIILFSISIIMSIVILAQDGIGFGHYTGSTIAIVGFIFSLAAVAVAIVQIIIGVTRKHTISLVAGIAGIIGGFIWIVAIIALIINIIIVIMKESARK